jgi:hypothetical protein
MSQITFSGQMIEIDAALVAKGLHMDPGDLRDAMQQGHVTRKVEKGEGEDAGRFRVTFYSPTRRLRLLFDAQGVILQTSSADYSRKARKTALPKDVSP